MSLILNGTHSGGVALTSNILSTNTPWHIPIIQPANLFQDPVRVVFNLPIELTRFNGDCNNGEVILTWQTASEKQQRF